MRAYVALTKPRVMELLLVVTVPAEMPGARLRSVLAAYGVDLEVLGHVA